MNIRILDSWLREYLDTKATPIEIQELLSLSGPAVERLEKAGSDHLYDIEVTTNRIDAASVYGIAREAATILKRNGIPAELRPLDTPRPEPDKDAEPITLKDPERLLDRMLAIIIEDVEVGESPAYIRERLEAAGIRALNNLIDITNYVMLEVGHPAHVFDLDRLNSRTLLVRQARKGEEIVTLDGKKHRLDNTDVVIDDGTGRIIDLPGIMGTENSVVHNGTKRILFFIESNDPVNIRRSSMRHGIRTMAASYNENSPDPNLAETAFFRGVALYRKLAKGKVAGRYQDVRSEEAERKVIGITLADIRAYMAVEIGRDEVVSILADLGFGLEEEKDSLMRFEVPSHRMNDIGIKEDLIEEVARIYGYGRIPTHLPPFAYITDDFIRTERENFQKENETRKFLAHLGFFEVHNYSMISEEEEKLFGTSSDSIKMINPMSKELVSFRQSLVPSLVKDARINKGYQGIMIFEIANTYLPRENDLPLESRTLGLVMRGGYDRLKGFVDALLKFSKSRRYSYRAGAGRPYLKEDLSAKIYIDNREAGYIGQVDPRILYELSLPDRYVVAEIDMGVYARAFRYLESVPESDMGSPVIEDITYEFSPKAHWEEITRGLSKRFPEIWKIEYVSRFRNFITMRIYSHPGKAHKTILPDMTAYLENDARVRVKRSTDGNNK